MLRHHLRLAIQQHAIAVVAHRRDGEQLADQAGHATDVSDEQRLTGLQITLGPPFQRRAEQLGTLHAACHQQDVQPVIEGVGLVELVAQGPGRETLARLQSLYGSSQQGQAQQHPAFHRLCSTVEKTRISSRSLQPARARQKTSASGAASRTKTWLLAMPCAARRANTAPISAVAMPRCR
ncbi:hypothetical protein D3C78_1033610 [compost metagenome]